MKVGKPTFITAYLNRNGSPYFHRKWLLPFSCPHVWTVVSSSVVFMKTARGIFIAYVGAIVGLSGIGIKIAFAIF